MLTPEIEGSIQEVYYGNKGSLTAASYAYLGLDDSQFEGHETITMGPLFNGTYTIYVYNYSQEAVMGNSEASVTVYKGNQEIQPVFINPNGTHLIGLLVLFMVQWVIFLWLTNSWKPIQVVYKTAPKTPKFNEDELVPSYHCTFGTMDGESIEENPLYAFANPGLYSVELTVDIRPYFSLLNALCNKKGSEIRAFLV